MTSSLDDLDQGTRSVLDTYRFDEAEFVRLRSAVCNGSISPGSNVVRGRIEPPHPEDILRLPGSGDPGHQDARTAGLEILRAGRAASVVLNGGMATRFGGVVKGIVEAVDGRSFLELKLAQAAQLADAVGAGVPVAVMNSFATDQPTRDFLAERAVPPPISFTQYVSLRLASDCSLFRGRDGKPSLYSPGHGDFLLAFRRSGTLQALRSAGVRYVMVSNVDNVPARLDPVVLGAHALAGRPMTTEVVRNEGDVGGAPVRVDGRMVILESMRFPSDFDHSRLPVTNANTVTFDIDALDRDFELTWLYVQKTVEDQTAVQLEHLYHEAASFLPTTYLQVPAGGPGGRFLPVKRPADLAAAQRDLRALMSAPPLD
jgi:UTP--glucose-1-phosphate uridylyltransferase